jgi:arylsulfatase A-like enzyme
MILHDWFDWSNAGVGTAGLMLTLLAVRQATGAKRAAEDARQAVYGRNAADAFAETVRLAEHCAEYLLLERPNEAAVRARDLVARIPRDRTRFERFIVADSDKLKILESGFQVLATRLSSEDPLEEKEDAQDAIDRVFDAIRELNAIYGRLLARLDEEGL